MNSNRTYQSCFCFIESNLFCNGITQPQTPAQGHAHSRAAKTRICSQQCDKNIVTKYATFTPSLLDIMTGNSDFETELKRNQEFNKVFPPL